MMMKKELIDLCKAIEIDNVDLVFDLIIQKITYSENDIITFLRTMSLCDRQYSLSFSGSGGSRVFKPNYTSITSLYFAAAGYDVLKIGSTKKTGLFGSTDFFEFLGSNEYIFKNNGYLKYYDVDKIMPWFKYRNLLSINESFKSFFSSYIFNPIKTTIKIAGIAGEGERRLYGKLKQIIAPDKLFIISSDIGKRFIDEASDGIVYIGDELYYNWGCNYKDLRLNNENDIIKINISLVTGEAPLDDALGLIRNMAIYLSIIENISVESALETVKEWYSSKIILKNQQFL